MAEERKISEIIKANYDRITEDPFGSGRVFAEELARLATDAIVGGMGSQPWIDYMSYFKDSQRQLDKLCGRNETFNNYTYGKKVLAYMIANATCTIDTAQPTTGRYGGTAKFLSKEDLRRLDDFPAQ